MRDFIFIDDVVEAYLVSSKLKNTHGEVFNIGSGIQYETVKIASTIVNLIAKDVRINWENDLNRQYEPAIWVSDNKRIYGKLNWKPNVDINTGLNNTINWFINNLHLYK